MKIMAKMISKPAVFLLIAFNAVAGASQDLGQAAPRDPDSLRSTFGDILIGSGKAGGSVIVKKDCESKKIVAQPKQPAGSKENPFDFLTKTNLDYRVIRNSKSINLLPTDYEPEILKTHINYFVIDSSTSAESTLQELLGLDNLKPLVDATLLNKGYSMEIWIGGSSPPMPEPRKFKHLYNVTLRRALNEIAIFYRNGIWAYTEDRCDGKVRSSLRFIKG